MAEIEPIVSTVKPIMHVIIPKKTYDAISFFAKHRTRHVDLMNYQAYGLLINAYNLVFLVADMSKDNVIDVAEAGEVMRVVSQSHVPSFMHEHKIRHTGQCLILINSKE